VPDTGVSGSNGAILRRLAAIVNRAAGCPYECWGLSASCSWYFCGSVSIYR